MGASVFQSMNGQWMGSVKGESPGLVVFELDDYGTSLNGIAHHFPSDNSLPAVATRFSLKNRESKHRIRGCRIIPIHPTHGFALIDADITKYYPNSIVGDFADIDIEILESGDVHIRYKTEVSEGEGTLLSSLAGSPSSLRRHSEAVDWNSFKSWAFNVEPQRYFYRGQSTPKRLRTSFHRTNRKDISWYRDWDIPEMRRVLSAQLSHFFNLRDGDENGAFYSLLQHHGYPTPLLDWSLSPFVAAYFAFCAKPVGRPLDDVVRIYVFDAKRWRRDLQQHPYIAHVPPHFSILDLHALENHRMVPQQAKATLTNVDDIETYLLKKSSENNHNYLIAVDLPSTDRERALSELNMMGINAGSLFPGIDGTCEAMRYRNFEA